jgi:predicted nucleotidyltransferase
MSSLVAHTSVNSCFHSRNDKKRSEISGRTNVKFVINNESGNTDVELDINKLSKNLKSQFLENIVIRDEISEENPNRYCNVDFVLRLGSNICLVY